MINGRKTTKCNHRSDSMIIKFNQTDKQLSSFAGLAFFSDIFKNSFLEAKIIDCIPTQLRVSHKNFIKFKQILLAMDAGAECLSDIDALNLDPGFVNSCGGKVYSAKSCADFLRLFSSYQCKQLGHQLINYGYDVRLAAVGKTESITFDIDSTINQQHGRLMEGVKKNYKGTYSLDTLQVYDEFGIQYWSEVRPGNTHTASGAIETIHHLFHRQPKELKDKKRYLRADRGFCSLDIFDACMIKGVKFVIGLRALMLRPLVKQIQHWYSQNPENENRIIFKDNRECEIGETVYHPKNVKRKKTNGDRSYTYRVVMIRAVKKEILEEEKRQKSLLPKTDDDYDYFAWCTSIGSSEMKPEQVIDFYRKRGHAENYIKDIKNAFDQHHYPCQKLNANKAYSIITGFAYNIMRCIAIVASKENDQKKIPFTKSIRLKFVMIPAQVVAHAREITFRFNKNISKEVFEWREKFKSLQWRFENSCFT